MKFKSYLSKYNELLDKKQKLQESLNDIENENIKDIVLKEINNINSEIFEFKNQELYDEAYIENFKSWN